MKQYIDKDALVAEIEELDNFWHLSKSASGQAFVESLLSFINTLEVKEVDLDESARYYLLHEHISPLNEAAIAYNKKVNFVVTGNVPNEHFIAGAQWQEEQLIDKAVEWIEDNLLTANQLDNGYINKFRKAMEE